MKERIIALPKNERLREDVEPFLREALFLERSNDNTGTMRSPYLPNVKLVSLRTTDIERLVKQSRVDIGVLGDDQAIETRFETGENLGLRQFGLVPKTPAKLRYLIREEDFQKFEELGVQPNMTGFGEAMSRTSSADAWTKNYISRDRVLGKERICITSYPNTLNALSFAQSWSNFNFPQQLQPIEVCTVDGQVEASLRNGIFGNAVMALDLVRSGETAAKYSLRPLGGSLLTALPSFWVPKTDINDPWLNELVQKLKEKLLSVTEITEEPVGPLSSFLYQKQ